MQDSLSNREKGLGVQSFITIRFMHFFASVIYLMIPDKPLFDQYFAIHFSSMCSSSQSTSTGIAFAGT